MKHFRSKYTNSTSLKFHIVLISNVLLIYTHTIASNIRVLSWLKIVKKNRRKREGNQNNRKYAVKKGVKLSKTRELLQASKPEISRIPSICSKANNKRILVLK